MIVVTYDGGGSFPHQSGPLVHLLGRDLIQGLSFILYNQTLHFGTQDLFAGSNPGGARGPLAQVQVAQLPVRVQGSPDVIG